MVEVYGKRYISKNLKSNLSRLENDLVPHASSSNIESAKFDGEKFFGGFGPTKLFSSDYWTLRARSKQLFDENPYARGSIRRLITNEINTGLSPEYAPVESILGLKEGSLHDWSESMENRHAIWAKNPLLCDYCGLHTFGSIQRLARQTALIEGDVLVVLRMNKKYNLPAVQLISGSSVRTPFNSHKSKNKIKHGVEFDSKSRHVAFWIVDEAGKEIRIPAYGKKSGRKMAWLLYGSDRKLDDVRGQPFLSLFLQSLKEIDRYRDSVQRKAVINSILALFISKNSDKPSSLAFSGGISKRDTVFGDLEQSGVTKSYDIARKIPGVVIEDLNEGEIPHGFDSKGTDLDFGKFEEAIVSTYAWVNEIPPEILRLTYSNNYSASQAAINEFRMYLNRIWVSFGEEFCSPVEIERLISELLMGKIEAAGLLDSWIRSDDYDVFSAWTTMDWYGAIKPSSDMVKQTKGSINLVNEGWSTNARESRVLSGTKFSKNISRLKAENAQKAEALRPILELKKEFGDAEVESVLKTGELRILKGA